ncbi:HD domain-containing protein [Olivibacter ginsenosidimutans]|uniref:HD domain-containing protein n=1 Tax=Olivibacter ginsenosidimutans TaxID=1176537 RepID=A0ABP9AIK9_9SPHI
MTLLIEQTITFVKQTLKDAEAGHDWFHVARVWKNAQHILKTEKADTLVVELAALLHDIADSKFHNGDEEIGPTLADQFLHSLAVPEHVVIHVVAIIRNMSYKASLGTVNFSSKEMEIVQDADRLDAMGAIGIARAFHYGGFKNRPLYDPQIRPNPNQDKATYKNSTSPTINHFYEKLLLLKDKMNTDTGRKMAINRHEFMEQFLANFFAEWEGEQ